MMLSLQRGSVEEPVSLLAPHQKVEEEEEGVKWQSKAGIVTWSPPQPNWNPWVGCNIDEGPMAHVCRRYLKTHVIIFL